jgi:hypothetical protein
MTITDEAPTTDLFISDVLLRKPCKDHDAGLGLACFQLVTDDGVGLAAVCNRRARAAGFNASVSPQSLNRGKNQRPKK